MQYIPIKTPVLQPPQDSLYAVLDSLDLPILPGDVIAVSSKVIAIDEGCCVPIPLVDKAALVREESELLIPRPYWSSPLTVKHGAFIGNAGVDESNGSGHYVLLPRDPFASAEQLYHYFSKRFHTTELGIIITDSHSTPLRRGAMGISISFWGIAPTVSHVGTEDIFGRPIKVEVSNLVDGLAAGAGVVMGETNECQPVVIIRDVPNLTFTTESLKHTHHVGLQDDTYRVLYQSYLPTGSDEPLS